MATAEIPTAKIVMASTECPVDTVTVFNDRAEVTRRVNMTIGAVGDKELVIEGLPASVDPESVRVSGTGHVVLNEVSYGTHQKVVVAEAEEEGKGAEGSGDTTGEESTPALRSKLERLNKEVAASNTRTSEVQRSLTMLNDFTNQALSTTRRGGKEDPKPTAESMAASMDFAFNMLDKNQARMTSLNKELARLANERKGLQREISVVQHILSARNAPRRSHTVTSRDVTVVFTAKAAGPVSLELIYMVSGASWSPSYDARIETSATKLELTYYGNIRQSTGEDWTGAQLILSTATPSVGGSAPILPTRHIGYFDPTVRMSNYTRKMHARPVRRRKQKMRTRGRRNRGEMLERARAASLSDSDEEELEEAKVELVAPVAAVETATVQSSGAAATYQITRRKTIKSDNKPHRVTIAILHLASTFQHYSVPSLGQSAYLQCETTNTSKYTLLASSQVSVFLDNSFITKTKLPAVSPGEKFKNYLGVDASVKITYRPISNVHHTSGMFVKSEDTEYKFLTCVKNTKAHAITIVVRDALPLSGDTSIRVVLAQPTNDEVEAGNAAAKKVKLAAKANPRATVAPFNHVELDSHNHLLWTRIVEPGTEIQIPFQYKIEYPAGKTIMMT